MKLYKRLIEVFALFLVMVMILIYGLKGHWRKNSTTIKMPLAFEEESPKPMPILTHEVMGNDTSNAEATTPSIAENQNLSSTSENYFVLLAQLTLLSIVLFLIYKLPIHGNPTVVPVTPRFNFLIPFRSPFAIGSFSFLSICILVFIYRTYIWTLLRHFLISKGYFIVVLFAKLHHMLGFSKHIEPYLEEILFPSAEFYETHHRELVKEINKFVNENPNATHHGDMLIKELDVLCERMKTISVVVRSFLRSWNSSSHGANQVVVSILRLYAGPDLMFMFSRMLISQESVYQILHNHAMLRESILVSLSFFIGSDFFSTKKMSRQMLVNNGVNSFFYKHSLDALTIHKDHIKDFNNNPINMKDAENALKELASAYSRLITLLKDPQSSRQQTAKAICTTKKLFSAKEYLQSLRMEYENYTYVAIDIWYNTLKVTTGSRPHTNSTKESVLDITIMSWVILKPFHSLEFTHHHQLLCEKYVRCVEMLCKKIAT